MQMKYYQPLQTSFSNKALQKSTSMPSMAETATSSNNSIESSEDQYRKQAVKWILNFHKKVQKDTQYLAISILQRLSYANFPQLNQQNHQVVAMAVVLLASKMNEIYPPKITQMLVKCKRSVSKQQVIAMECMILTSFRFDIAQQQTTYSYLYRLLNMSHADKLEQCEKLYKMIACYKQIYQFGQQILSYAIVYLIIPQLIRDMRLKQNAKIKALAIRIYNIYTQSRDKFQRQKQNRYR